MNYKEKLIKILSTNPKIEIKVGIAENANTTLVNQTFGGVNNLYYYDEIGFEDLFLFLDLQDLGVTIYTDGILISQLQKICKFDFFKSLLQQDEQVLKQLVEFLEHNL